MGARMVGCLGVIFMVLTKWQLDFSRSTAAMNQSHQALLKAEMLEQDYEMVRKEWRELYE